MNNASVVKKYRHIDRNWRNVGRIRVAVSGYNLDTVSGMKAMLSHIKRTGQVELWKVLAEKSGDDPLGMYRKYQRNELDKVVFAESIQPAKPLMIEWASKRQNSGKSYRQYVNDLLRDHENAKLKDLPMVLSSVHERYRVRGQLNAFKKCRAVALAYLTATKRKGSALYKEVAAVKADFSSSFVFKGRAREVWEVVETVKAMKAPHGQMFWSMCLLGANPKEYLVDGFEIESDQFGPWVRVRGKKNNNRDRQLPLPFHDLTKPERAIKWFRIALHEVQPDWQLADARKSFSHWMNMANIPKIRRQLYMGHNVRDVHSVYNIHEIRHYLNSDAELLRNYILSNLKRPEFDPSVLVVPKSPVFE